MSFRRLVIILILIAILTGIYVSCSTSKNSDMNDNAVSKTTEESTSTKTGEDTKASGDTKAADRTSIKNTQQSETQQQQHDTQQPEQQLPSQLPKPSFVDRKSTEVLNIERNTIQYEPKVKPYIINSDLSNIVNIEQYGDFTHEQKELIAKNGFVVVSSNEEQLFYIYENNEYLKLPSFVTTDSVLQVFHLFFDYSLRILETEKLMLPLKQMTDSMLKKSIVLYNQIKAPQLKTAALKNIAYFAVAQKALGEEYPSVIPDEAKKLAELEFALVEGAAGIAKSNIFPFDLDYSQYKPRGHYTRNEEFEKYFRAMMWYGQAPFPVFKATPDGKVELNVEQTAQALLITYCMFCNIDGSSDIELWEKIYEPTVFYVGNTDDLNLYQYKDLLISIYGEEPDIEKLLEPHYIERLYSGAKLLPEPQIQAKWISVDIPSGLQFRFMGQRYIPDSDIMQNLVEPIIRPVPRGLDVMGVLGSERASDLLINKYKEGEKWEEYKSRFAEQKSRFSKLPEETWHSNMYYGWLWTLRGLLKSFGDGYPSFMTNEAWEDKSLSTALASWAEMRHDTILYAKPTGAECGEGEEPPVIKSYVEPNIEVYNRLLGLTSYARENLR